MCVCEFDVYISHGSTSHMDVILPSRWKKKFQLKKVGAASFIRCLAKFRYSLFVFIFINTAVLVYNNCTQVITRALCHITYQLNSEVRIWVPYRFIKIQKEGSHVRVDTECDIMNISLMFLRSIISLATVARAGCIGRRASGRMTLDTKWLEINHCCLPERAIDVRVLKN